MSVEVLGKMDEKLYCIKCKRETNHDYVYKHSERSYDFDINDYYWFISYFVTRCRGCDNVAYATEYGDESMLRYEEYSGREEIYSTFTSYPEKPKKDTTMRLKKYETREFLKTPESITVLYTQLVSALNDQAYLLTAVGLRMLVEGICNDLGITEGYLLNEDGSRKLNKNSDEIRDKNLIGKINGLVEKNVIVQRQADILHKIRELGNTSVHELIVPPRSTILLSFEIIENVIYNVYELDKYKII
ncbi:DUF4145 domain-containing protein [Jeotgalibacillus sp. S-D1]|uniref:DUF4145 domain-containing protein n=1 Tax=Jeotgalibacillus sp. S-D1 TaxID=2552189 RepID=UPI001059E45A|nr:DUF4145 domain-containing protein [Jeotgalibacillus sp. S-D1]TDL34565.1 DUF4145 domain-containing protein [Jeotgalibacillus sp. S-D1]